MSHDTTRCGELFDRVSSYLDGEMAEGACSELAAHLEGCDACRRFLESLRSTRDALRAAGASPEVREPECEALLRECLRAVLDRSRVGETGRS
jgi:anti-sigma factor RsiW